MRDSEKFHNKSFSKKSLNFFVKLLDRDIMKSESNKKSGWFIEPPAKCRKRHIGEIEELSGNLRCHFSTTYLRIFLNYNRFSDKINPQ